jgi:predicted nucleic acid-binding protein
MIEILLQTELGVKAERHLRAAGDDIFAPRLIDYEVAQTLRRFANSGEVSDERGRAALADMQGFNIILFAYDYLKDRIWSLRGNLSAYDAAYVALAEMLEVPLLTCDRRIERAPGVKARFAEI